jgi:hypothetical protein
LGGGWYAAGPGFFATVGCINQKNPNTSAASIPNEAANAPVTAAASAKRELLESKMTPKNRRTQPSVSRASGLIGSKSYAGKGAGAEGAHVDFSLPGNPSRQAARRCRAAAYNAGKRPGDSCVPDPDDR